MTAIRHPPPAQPIADRAGDSVEGDTIVLIRHAGNINTVYDNVTSVTVEQGDTVRRGQAFAEVAQGDPQALRFGVGIGTESTDPLPYLQ
ncbi:MAG TPA: hypothetical protein DDY29_05350 [Rhodobacteraceae bacterium]|nr:hypothetical protein [Paracoccaceae bacterium]